VEQEQSPARAPGKAFWTPLDTLAVLLVTAVGGGLRLVRVAQPQTIVFDEVYYAKEACYYAMGSLTACGLDTPPNEVHPPLGKWLIAAGIKAFGFDSFGWRIAAVVAGTITIALLYVLAKKILGSTLGAALASGLLAIDFLHFVQSRIAMLDIFVALFGVASVLFVVLDRERLIEGAIQGGRLRRPWRLAAGIAAGAATATKWSGALFVVAVIVLTVAWEAAARREDDGNGWFRSRGRSFSRAMREQGLNVLLWLVLAPLLVYALSYLGRIEGSLLTAPWDESSWFRQLVVEQKDAGSTHLGLPSNHAYESPPWSWLLLKRPVSYFYCAASKCNPDVPEGHVEEILATGSPFVWWASILALVYAFAGWARRRSFWRPEGVIIAGFFLTYAPWLLLSRNRPAVFLFYLVPVVPFMCLALGYVAARIGRSWEARAAVALFAAGAIALFAFYYPVLAGTSLSQEEWEARMWVFKGSQCDKPRGTPSVASITTTVEGEVKTRTTTTLDNSSLPPTGWCWI
jgi:dolichyl-phosphate-mannose--protein O-mannosyl transferase